MSAVRWRKHVYLNTDLRERNFAYSNMIPR